jgi:hypothetical protein
VDDFGVEYVGEEHVLHLASVLKQYHEISEDWKGKKFAGIDLGWNYAKVHKDRTCCLSMKGYIADLLLRLGHPKPSKPQLFPYKSKDIAYGSSIYLSPEEDTSSQLDKDGVTEVQMVVGALLWVGQAVNNKLLVVLIAIGPNKQQPQRTPWRLFITSLTTVLPTLMM